MESELRYQVTSPIEERRSHILKSQEFYWTAAFTNALIMSGCSFEDDDELLERATSIKDKLILKIMEEK